MLKSYDRIYECNYIVLDTETDGLHPVKNKAFGVGIKTDKHEFYVDLNVEADRIYLKRQLMQFKGVLVGHNLKFDIHMLISAGFDQATLMNTQIHDTFIYEALVDEHKGSYSLDSLANEYFGTSKIDMVSLINEHFGTKMSKNKAMSKISEMPVEFVSRYCIVDVRLTEQLYLKQLKQISDASWAWPEFDGLFSLEMDVLKALVNMERKGVSVSVERLEEVESYLDTLYEEKQEEFNREAGFFCNVDSSPDLVRLFDRKNYTYKTTAKGNPSFSKGALESLTGKEGELAKQILEIRSVKKNQNSFVGGLKKYIHNGRIHANFNQLKGDQFGTKTGRLSCSQPNLQQIPKRNGEMFNLVRSMFRPDHENQKWVCGDWEQFEFRVFAHYSQDKRLLKEYNEDPTIDFHQIVSDMTGVERSKAKRINLGLVFGMGSVLLAKELGLPTGWTKNYYGEEFEIPGPEAQELFNTYHSRFPNAKQFLKHATNIAAKRGYVRTVAGRRLRFPDKRFTYKAGGLLLQSTAADIMKRVLVDLDKELDLRLCVHDEFNTISNEENVESDIRKFKQIVEDVTCLDIPVLSDIHYGENWYDAAK